MALITTMVNIPLLVASVLSGGATAGGLLLLHLTLFIPVGAVIGGALAERLSYRVVAATGMVCTAIGFWLMSAWHTDTADLQMTLNLALAGLGFGLVIAPITSTTLAWVDEEQAGLASALVNTARMIGMILGLAALTSWGLSRFKQLIAEYTVRQQRDPAILSEVLHHVYTDIFLAAAVICLIAILPAAVLWRRQETAVVEDVSAAAD